MPAYKKVKRNTPNTLYAEQRLGVKQTLLQGDYPADTWSDEGNDLGGIFRGLTTPTQHIRESGSYILAPVSLDDSDSVLDRENPMHWREMLVQLKASGATVKHSHPQYVSAKERDLFEGFVNNIVEIAQANPDNSVKLFMPALCHDSHWCVLEVNLIKGKVVNIELWDPMGEGHISRSGFERLQAIAATHAADIAELQEEQLNCDSEDEKQAIAKELEQAIAVQEVFAHANCKHVKACRQFNATSCGDFSSQEILRRQYPCKDVEATNRLAAISPALVQLRDVEHTDGKLRQVVLRKALVDVLVARDHGVLGHIRTMVQTLLQSIDNSIRARQSDVSEIEKTAILDAEWNKVSDTLIHNRLMQENIDAHLARKMQDIAEQAPNISDKALFAKAREALLVEQGSALGLGHLVGFFTPKANTASQIADEKQSEKTLSK